MYLKHLFFLNYKKLDCKMYINVIYLNNQFIDICTRTKQTKRYNQRGQNREELRVETIYKNTGHELANF